MFAAGIAAIGFGAAGCSDSDAGASAGIRIAPAIETRVTGLHFDAGDQIGLTIVRGSDVFVENRMMTYDGSVFAAAGLSWYDERQEPSTLMAYYPYAQAGAPGEFVVASDQSRGCAPSDLLAAVKSDVTPVSAPVAMVFRHLMSQIDVIVTNRSGSSLSAVRLDGLVATAEVDFAALSARAKSGAATSRITACEETSGLRYRAVVVPQSADLRVVVETADGKSYDKAIPAVELGGGKRYDLSIELTDAEIVVSLSGEIRDWDEGGQLGGGAGAGGEEGPVGGEGGDTPGDVVGGNTPAEGTLLYEGVAYRTAIVAGRRWMAENLRYLPAGATLGSGVWNPASGADHVAEQGLLYDFATATCGETAQPVRGICPEGWHIPSVAELETLITAAGDDFYIQAGFMPCRPGSTGNYGSPGKSYLMSSELADTEGKCMSLVYGNVQTELKEVTKTYGISVRCVAD